MNVLFFYLLAKATNVGELGSFARILNELKNEALDSVDVYVSAVIVIVSLILVFKLVKMSYSVMADEQHGGFGGIKLWDILRPLAIVLIIQNCSLFVNLLDSGVTMFTDAMFDKVSENVVKAKTGEEITKFEVGNKQFDISSKAGRKAAADSLAATNGLNNELASLEQGKKELESKLESGNGQADFYTNENNIEILKQIGVLNQRINELKDNKKYAVEALGEYVDCNEELDDPRSRLAVWAQWVYDRFVFVMICITDIVLCCFIVFAPLVFSLSLIDKWRSALMNWVGGYIQVSLWKVTVAIINWCVQNARTVALAWVRDKNYAAVMDFAETGVSGEYANSGIWLVVGAAIAIAGVLCLFLTPSITHMILSLGSAPGDVQGAAKSEFMAPVSAAKGAASIGSKFIK